MGRTKKYQTDEEKLESQRKWALEYYYRNKEELNSKRMKDYYERKNKME